MKNYIHCRRYYIAQYKYKDRSNFVVFIAKQREKRFAHYKIFHVTHGILFPNENGKMYYKP